MVDNNPIDTWSPGRFRVPHEVPVSRPRGGQPVNPQNRRQKPAYRAGHVPVPPLGEQSPSRPYVEMKPDSGRYREHEHQLAVYAAELLPRRRIRRSEQICWWVGVVSTCGLLLPFYRARLRYLTRHYY